MAIAGAIGFGAVTTGTLPVNAQAVRVETTQQNPGFADVVERVSPAVVSVRVKSDVAPVSDRRSGSPFTAPGFEDLPQGHPLNRFFREFRGEGDRQSEGRRGGQRDRAERARPSSQGSGFFISEDGYVVTNNHVIRGLAEGGPRRAVNDAVETGGL